MKKYYQNNQSNQIHTIWILMILTSTVMAVLLSACASTSAPVPTSTPSPLQPSPQPTEPNTGSTDNADALVAGAKTALAEKFNLSMDKIQLVDVQPAQWPDGCLGVQEVGIMCAMHVVDGFQIRLQANDLTYEVRSNQDGSQYAVVHDPVPGSTNETDALVAGAKSALADELNLDPNEIQLVDTQQVQWPDGCLGVQEVGIMCAMHVVDGYQIRLQANDLIYEVRSNQDGSQYAVVRGPVPNTVGFSFSSGINDQCQTYLFTPEQDVQYGPCWGALQTANFIEPSRADELNHFLETYQPYSTQTGEGTMNFFGTGDMPAAPAEQRSITSWVNLVIDETQSGRSDAATGLVIGWHREGGLAGFCEDVMVYNTGLVSASSCKNGSAQDLGNTWLDVDQLTQLYQWMDTFSKFEYSPKTGAVADAITIDLIFSGVGNMAAGETDQVTIENFTEQIYQISSGEAG